MLPLINVLDNDIIKISENMLQKILTAKTVWRVHQPTVNRQKLFVYLKYQLNQQFLQNKLHKLYRYAEQIGT